MEREGREGGEGGEGREGKEGEEGREEGGEGGEERWRGKVGREGGREENKWRGQFLGRGADRRGGMRQEERGGCTNLCCAACLHTMMIAFFHCLCDCTFSTSSVLSQHNSIKTPPLFAQY